MNESDFEDDALCFPDIDKEKLRLVVPHEVLETFSDLKKTVLGSFSRKKLLGKSEVYFYSWSEDVIDKMGARLHFYVVSAKAPKKVHLGRFTGDHKISIGVQSSWMGVAVEDWSITDERVFWSEKDIKEIDMWEDPYPSSR